MNLHKLFHGFCAIVFVALFIGGAAGAQHYHNPTLAHILPYVILMVFGMLGLLIQFVLIHQSFMKNKE